MRLIAIGGEALAEGFALLGFETLAGPDSEEVEALIEQLLRSGERALVFLEDGLLDRESESLNQVRREGGRVVVTEVPPLESPADYHPRVEDLVRRVLGPSALEDRP